MPDPREVRAMFGRIAGRYDFLNHFLSAGIDRRWRRAVLEQAGETDGRLVVDSCCGTGDLSLAFQRAGARVVGVDFVPAMLERARKKPGAGAAPPRLFTCGDALQLPIADGRADIASIAFGIRNVADRGRGLAELARVVRPGGAVLVLEFSMPPGRLLGSGYRFYFRSVLPRLGGWISGDRSAYEYLPETVLAWPTPVELQAEMETLGLVDCGYRLLSGGIACLSFGRVADAPPAGSAGDRLA